MVTGALHCSGEHWPWSLDPMTPMPTMTQLWHTWEYSGQDEKTTAPVIYLGTTSIIIMQCTVLAEIYLSSSQNDIERTEVMAIIRFMDSDWKVIKHVVPRIADICWQFVGLSRVGVSGIWISLVMALWRPLYGVIGHWSLQETLSTCCLSSAWNNHSHRQQSAISENKS